MKRALVLFAIGVLAAGALWVRGCSGPTPRLLQARMRGPLVEVVLENDSAGEGVVQVDLRLHPPDGGPPLVHSEHARLQPHDRSRLTIRVEGARGDESVEAALDYPPR